MAIKERTDRITANDSVYLRLFTFNGGSPSDASSINGVTIYRLNVLPPTSDNPYGKYQVVTIDPTQVSHDGQGQYSVLLQLSSPLFTTDNYQDEWDVTFDPDLPSSLIDQYWSIVPDSWYASPNNLTDLNFTFELIPNRIVQGSVQNLNIIIHPNTNSGTLKQKYYENMISGGNITLSLEQRCGYCLPEEKDLRLIIDQDNVVMTSATSGYYLLDSTELSCGVYDISLNLNLANQTFISPRIPFLVYE